VTANIRNGDGIWLLRDVLFVIGHGIYMTLVLTKSGVQSSLKLSAKKASYIHLSDMLGFRVDMAHQQPDVDISSVLDD
jgi:hypothetical protein